MLHVYEGSSCSTDAVAPLHRIFENFCECKSLCSADSERVSKKTVALIDLCFFVFFGRVLVFVCRSIDRERLIRTDTTIARANIFGESKLLSSRYH